MIQHAAPIVARLSLGGDKIILAGYSPDALEFYHSLPAARYDKGSRTWSCMRTPVAIHRIATFPGAQLADTLMQQSIDVRGRLLEASQFQDPDHAPAIAQPLSKTPLWHHQLLAFGFGRRVDACLLGMEMGCGKSLDAVTLVVYWGCKTVLVLCPRSVMGVWRREFEKHAARSVRVFIAENGTVKRKRDDAALFMAQPTTDMGVVVINYESAWREPFGDWALGRTWDAVIADESHRIAAHDSIQSKWCARLGLKAKRRLCLTGTPLTQSPLSLFGQFRFLDPGLVGTSWTHFNNRYATHNNPSIPQMVTGYKNQAELADRMKLVTFRCRAEDVLDLPDKHHIERRFALSPAAMRVYRQLEEELIAEVDGGVVTVPNALVKLVRLSQVCSGYLPLDETKEVKEIDDSKIEVLQELLEDMDQREPVVVFCRFRQDLAKLADLAEKLGRRYGEQSGSRKDALDDKAMMREDIDLAGVQIASGGLGVDFTRARYAVYYSIGQSLVEYKQSIARLHRPGQTRRVTYYHLIAENTVDVLAYKALERNQEIVDAVLSVFKSHNRREIA